MLRFTTLGSSFLASSGAARSSLLRNVTVPAWTLCSNGSTFASSRLFSTSTSAATTTTSSNNPNMKIFFGSQTGTAKSFANQLARELKKNSTLKAVPVQVVDMDKFPPSDLFAEPQNTLAVFVTACYGTGQPTDNAKKMFDWIMSPQAEEKAKASPGLAYAIFGLGKKKTYADRYQAVARALDQRLQTLGAQKILKGEGDDDGNIEDDFDEWKENLIPILEQRCGGKAPSSSAESSSSAKTRSASKSASVMEDPYDSTAHWKLEWLPASPTSTEVPKAPGGATWQPLVRNDELKQPWMKRSSRHLSFDLTGSSLTYEAGDHLGVFPQNSRHLVESVARRLGVDLQARFTINYPSSWEAGDKTDSPWNSVLPQGCSVDECLSSYCDLTAMPRRSVLEGLAHWAKDECEKAHLFQIARSDEYNSWIVQSRRNVLEVLEAFPSVQPEFVHFVELMMRNPIQCRFYSISSSPKPNPNRLDLLVDVVHYTAITGTEKFGLASGYLSRLPLGARVPMFVRKSTFRLPSDPSIPVILVGAGSGLAPLRAFLQERAWLKANSNTLGPCVLYFGCDRKEGDFLHRAELEAFEQDGITVLRPAFAFDQDTRVYVQHLMMEDGSKLWRLIEEEGAYVYVCGNAQTVGIGVYGVLQEIAQKYGSMNLEKAKSFVTRLIEQGRLQEDVF